MSSAWGIKVLFGNVDIIAEGLLFGEGKMIAITGHFLKYIFVTKTMTKILLLFVSLHFFTDVTNPRFFSFSYLSFSSIKFLDFYLNVLSPDELNGLGIVNVLLIAYNELGSFKCLLGKQIKC